ncbi:MAG TPA: class I SAM-dependent methyltransferase, partial [Phototrophicaceae bacterium]|nr:class I SAM-dependent methyltransferase [Phototrophicaceae bacterium]
SLSIHHLEDADKQDLFRRVYAALRPGGIFLNVDQIKGPTPALHEFYWTQWLKQVRQKGLPETQIQESIQRRQTYDREALLTEQLDWLAQTGFVEVDCLYKQYFIGVFYAVKPQRATA